MAHRPNVKKVQRSGKKQQHKNALPLHKIKVSLPRSDRAGAFPVGMVDEKNPLAKLDSYASRSLAESVAMGFAGYTPLPNRLRCKMKYSEIVALSTAGTTPAVYVFNASSLYDPDYTSTGHQPRGFDQIMPLYDHFVVLHSHIKVAGVMTSAGTGLTGVMGVQLNGTVTTLPSWIDYAEQARVVTVFNDYGAVQRSKNFEMKYSAQEFMGIPDPITADKLQGTISANPVDNAFYHVFGQDPQEATATTHELIVEIEYDAVFIEPLAVSQS